jgi:YaiO family outer membrane protein
MIALLLQLAASPSAAAAPDIVVWPTVVWQATAAAGLDHFSADRSLWPDWQIYQAAIQRRGRGGSIGLETQRTHRFGQWDQSFVVDGYRELGSRTYGNLRVLATPNAKILPRSDVSGTLYRALSAGWEASLGGRHMEFNDGRTTIVSAGLARSFSIYYARVAASVLVDDGAASSFSGALRRSPDPNDLIEVGGGAGREVVSIGSTGAIDVRRSASAYFRGEHYFSWSWGMNGAATLNTARGIPTRTGLQLGLLRRW